MVLISKWKCKHKFLQRCPTILIYETEKDQTFILILREAREKIYYLRKIVTLRTYNANMQPEKRQQYEIIKIKHMDDEIHVKRWHGFWFTPQASILIFWSIWDLCDTDRVTVTQGGFFNVLMPHSNTLSKGQLLTLLTTYN